MQFHIVVASQFKRKKMLVIAETFLGGKCGFENQFGVGQEKNAFLSEGDIFAGPVKQFDIQLFFQCLNLVGDSGLGKF